jgi:hypothetical protein
VAKRTAQPGSALGKNWFFQLIRTQYERQATPAESHVPTKKTHRAVGRTATGNLTGTMSRGMDRGRKKKKNLKHGSIDSPDAGILC